MLTIALAILFGAALVYGMHVASHACKSDVPTTHRGAGLSHEL
jgi:hypothetical protein